MKKIFLLIGFTSIVFILIALYFFNHEELAYSDTSHFGNSDSLQPKAQKRPVADEISTRVLRDRPVTSRPVTSVYDFREKEIKDLRRELEATKSELEILSRPLTQDMLSSAVNAEIAPGDTLVTGGYKTADGNYEITFLTPRNVTRSDGGEGIEIQSRVLSVGPEFVDKSGMGTLATNAGNTLQHGESWKDDDVKTTFTSASQNSGVNVMTAPKFTTSSSASSPFDIVIGEEDGPQFSIKGTVEKNSNGNFSIKSRVERRPGVQADAEPDAVSNP
jgi:hypothetical protein